MTYNPKALDSERKGRDVFLTLADLLNWLVEYTLKEFCGIDLHVSTIKNGRKLTASGEIKNRDASAIKYATHIIEIHKIKSLLADNKKLAMFINIIGDDIFIFDVVKINKMILLGLLIPYYKLLPDNNGAVRKFIPKLIVEVSKDLAVHFLKVEGIWIRQ